MSYTETGKYDHYVHINEWATTLSTARALARNYVLNNVSATNLIPQGAYVPPDSFALSFSSQGRKQFTVMYTKLENQNIWVPLPSIEITCGFDSSQDLLNGQSVSATDGADPTQLNGFVQLSFVKEVQKVDTGMIPAAFVAEPSYF